MDSRAQNRAPGTGGEQVRGSYDLCRVPGSEIISCKFSVRRIAFFMASITRQEHVVRPFDHRKDNFPPIGFQGRRTLPLFTSFVAASVVS